MFDNADGHRICVVDTKSTNKPARIECGILNAH